MVKLSVSRAGDEDLPTRKTFTLSLKENEDPPLSEDKTAFVHENYVCDAWARPIGYSLKYGPRSLRLFHPMSNMTITNLTQPTTQDRAVEGTVNRVILKLVAGEEACKNIQYTLTCTSSLSMMQDVDTSKQDETQDDDDNNNNNNDGEEVQAVMERIPVLVKRDPSVTSKEISSQGYSLLSGWSEVKSGATQQKLVPFLAKHGVAYLCFDLYRPISPKFLRTEREEEPLQTCVKASITYKQTRNDEQLEGDDVTLHYETTVEWHRPLEAEFSVKNKDGFPCANSKEENKLSENIDSGAAAATTTKTTTTTSAPHGWVTAMDGEEINIKCTLQATDATASLGTELRQVLFEVSFLGILCVFLSSKR